MNSKLHHDIKQENELQNLSNLVSKKNKIHFLLTRKTSISNNIFQKQILFTKYD